MGELGLLASGVELVDGEVRATNGDRPRRRWSYDEVVRMVHGGVLDEDERIELIEGDSSGTARCSRPRRRVVRWRWMTCSDRRASGRPGHSDKWSD